ncbi:ABC transporter permease [Acuticoccus mangrovi]|uniref:ABC transporter permease n=1 Tax=Acuticoccus mangrovi TaxID=2796142 RepID=A0A934MIF8_9HYPH|nr:ABC transporter permease [Acuticoccus mangrovi]MBJ3778723.1 ABC transporter permease [Acuticoccus mangrovi]
MLEETIRLALMAIRRNALRSLLTLLGVVIGVGSVIAMVTIGNGTTAQVQEQISSLGTNLLFLRPGQGMGPRRTSAPDFSLADAEAIRNQIAGLSAVAPTASTSVNVVAGNESWSTTVTGTSNDYFTARDWPLQDGRLFLDSEVRAGRAVCIIGTTIGKELFAGRDPLGEKIRIGAVPCTVIGLLETRGRSNFGDDQDDTVVMPLRTVQRRLAGNTDVDSIMLSAQEGVDTGMIQRDVTLLMRERRNIKAGLDDNFHVGDMAQIVSTMTGTTKMMTGLLAAVAGVSLLVGGIGILNIMLVSVTERTREIGIRLAIGAQEKQVLLQFLVEAVVLSLFGGLIGVLLGLGLSALASLALGTPLVLDITIVLLAFAVSVAIGVVFGYVPARRAAHLDPIDALRHE